ncbi:hypothetical protein [uncultured Flavobacterium sp.]|uniref:hypothetical protein n=1 Tax=uncultured Flavobacterium sp. TaxID=165435 RepID=UPI00292DF9BB|nr:hypothetical protein [uncultured Flavobacterium sp.]
MKKKILWGVFAFAAVLSIRLFCGVYVHDKFAERHFFIKYRPTWKWTFYSPIGISNKKIEELSKEDQIEQKYFNEFIIGQRIIL